MSVCERIRKTQTLRLPNGATVLFIFDVDSLDFGINEFYRSVGETCLLFCEDRLAKRLDGSCTYLYKLGCRANNAEKLSVTLTVSLSNKTLRRLMYSYSETHTWIKPSPRAKRQHAILSKRRQNKSAAEQG